MMTKGAKHNVFTFCHGKGTSDHIQIKRKTGAIRVTDCKMQYH